MSAASFRVTRPHAASLRFANRLGKVLSYACLLRLPNPVTPALLTPPPNKHNTQHTVIIDFASIDPDRRKFNATTLKLVAVAALGGLFTGARGGLFSVSNCRLAQLVQAAVVT